MSEFNERTLRDLAIGVSRVSPMSYADAFRSLEQIRGAEVHTGWIDEAKWAAAAEPPESMTCAEFMSEHAMSRADFGSLLREYRSDSGVSAFELGTRDTLDADFLNWFEWERL